MVTHRDRLVPAFERSLAAARKAGLRGVEFVDFMHRARPVHVPGEPERRLPGTARRLWQRLIVDVAREFGATGLPGAIEPRDPRRQSARGPGRPRLNHGDGGAGRAYQITLRLSDRQVAHVDRLVAAGRGDTRANAIRWALDVYP